MRAGGGWNLPVHAVDRVRLVMVPSLLVPHVDRQGSVDRWQEVRRHCTGERDRTSKPFPAKRSVQRALRSRISEREQRAGLREPGYHTHGRG